MYQQAGAAGAQPGPDMNAGCGGNCNQGGQQKDNIQDADFEEVK